MTTLAIVLPITTTDRGWPNHVVVDEPSGLDLPSWIMTEQPRTLSRDRLTGTAGEVTRECLASVRVWLGDFLGL
ncbi:type II toxin-antitoxin system PemK/MazF family toxin [Microbacterium oxydans]|uniref:type II toxin-antitoxin system PemK/MazF family toxin n=1 Tax=Microbacterium TaxID=33882 RepID=UPI0027E46630|nr:type II toxin-antitoxin system PemK/MazF family toxin [Microbacterium sp. R1]